MSSNLKARLLTFVSIIPPVIVFIYYSYLRVILAIIVGVQCFSEFYSITSSSSVQYLYFHHVFIIVVCLSAWLYDLIGLVSSILFIFILSYLILLVRCSVLSNSISTSSLTSFALCMFAHIWITFGVAHLPLLSNLGGALLIVYIIVVTAGGENGALAIGVLIGKYRCLPFLSPKKTFEGLVAGVFTSILCSMLWFYCFSTPSLSLSGFAILGLILGICGTIGDLFESFFKRCFDVKDTASLLPGWGGALDRVDGLLINLPITYYFLKFYL